MQSFIPNPITLYIYLCVYKINQYFQVSIIFSTVLQKIIGEHILSIKELVQKTSPTWASHENNLYTCSWHLNEVSRIIFIKNELHKKSAFCRRSRL